MTTTLTTAHPDLSAVRPLKPLVEIQSAWVKYSETLHAGKSQLLELAKSVPTWDGELETSDAYVKAMRAKESDIDKLRKEILNPIALMQDDYMGIQKAFNAWRTIEEQKVLQLKKADEARKKELREFEQQCINDLRDLECKCQNVIYGILDRMKAFIDKGGDIEAARAKANSMVGIGTFFAVNNLDHVDKEKNDIQHRIFSQYNANTWVEKCLKAIEDFTHDAVITPDTTEIENKHIAATLAANVVVEQTHKDLKKVFELKADGTNAKMIVKAFTEHWNDAIGRVRVKDLGNLSIQQMANALAALHSDGKIIGHSLVFNDVDKL